MYFKELRLSNRSEMGGHVVIDTGLGDVGDSNTVATSVPGAGGNEEWCWGWEDVGGCHHHHCWVMLYRKVVVCTGSSL